MFTGLVADVGRLAASTRSGNDVTLRIETRLPTEEFELGESIAVNGCCLTVTRIEGSAFTADASVETLERTNLGGLKIGDGVHLERALRLSDRLGGHIVQGHVDGVGRLVKRAIDGKAWQLWFALPEALLDEVVEKGSITIDGVSLTVNDVERDRVRVTVIPHTQDETLLSRYAEGQRVNIETDILGKYVKRLVERGRGEGSSRLADLLITYGYTSNEE